VRRSAVALVGAGLLTLAVVPTGPARAAGLPARSSLSAGQRLLAGQRLVSPDGRYVATVGRTGRLVVRTSAGRTTWRSPAAGAGAYATVGRGGQLTLRVGGRVRWTSRTAGSGRSDVLRLLDGGALTLFAGSLTVWSNRFPNACPGTAAKVVLVDISQQSARACSHRQQLRVTRVTTGATARGYGTPTGSGRVNGNKTRNTTLYPAAGGAYPVTYWLPYDANVYGLHDSSWQTFPYGSPRYRTAGSHGCVHVPLVAMRWLYHWATVGTRVTVRN
jgi:hypothetical protein